ncbi:glycosyltransferase family 2 protein [Sandaracinobacteroides sp. A072]|uniref:glycosyltransferase family 2 protein n=1 Tax=Sandaracinobacteroides sp. A072 TaxID=3461146 RepID=UPI00404364BF
MSAPRVSAIMIFLNGEKFIAEAIDSIIAQTFTDWELILVDDGSTDGSTAIAKSYAERHPGKIHYTEHPGHENRGMSASRNRGIAMARGDYVAFLDCDDVWLPRRLEVHVGILDAHPDVAMVMGATMWWRSWTRQQGGLENSWMDDPRDQMLPTHQLLPAPTVATSFLESRGKTLCGICSQTSRRQAILDVGGFNEAFRTLYEDQVFLFRMCLRHPVWAIPDVLDKYRQHPDSACNSEGRVTGDARMRPIFLAWLQDHLIDSGVKDEGFWRAFRAEMLRYDQPRVWWLSRLPARARDWWNVKSRRALMLALTPAGYNRLRRLFGKSYVDFGSVR